MRGKFRLALLASLVALTAASNTTDRRLFASKEEERLIGAPEIAYKPGEKKKIKHPFV